MRKPVFRLSDFFIVVVVLAVSTHCFANEEQKDEALQPALVLQPVPEKYSDKNRTFQGIPSMCVAPNGRLWATWYTGGDDEGDDNIVILVTSGDGGETWTKPILAIEIPDCPVRAYDPSMWTDPEGRVWLFWAQSKHWWDGRSGTWGIVTENPDTEDAKWSAPKRLCDGIMMCKPIADSKGRWLLPTAVWNTDFRKAEHPGRTLPCGANVVASEDKGKTWHYLGHSAVPEKDAIFDEHNIVEMKNGTFWMLHRTKYGIAESHSTDSGKTWTEPRPSIYPHTSSRFFIRRLKSGNLLFVKHGKINQLTGRSHLTAFLSDDDGKSWKGGLMLDERPNVSYPDGDQMQDGTICVIYDWERYKDKEILMARFTEEDVLAGKIVSSKGKLRMLVNKAMAVHPKHKPIEMASNDDGKPLMKGASPTFEWNNAEIDTFKKDVKLFGDREHYRLRNFLPELADKMFLRSSSIRRTGKITCKTPGITYVYTPLPNRNKDNIVDYLLENDFEKVATPEVMLFGDYTGNISTLYQKEVKVGETFEFGCWGLIVF